MHKEDYMKIAISKAKENILNGKGGPFGAVIVKDGTLIAAAGNRVTSTNDPTAHAEIVAIREACRALETFDLTGCEIYASCEPCPMCLGAILWARLGKLYYAADRHDAANAGFDDAKFYEAILHAPSEREIPSEQLLQETANEVFTLWNESENSIPY